MVFLVEIEKKISKEKVVFKLCFTQRLSDIIWILGQYFIFSDYKILFTLNSRNDS